jgi:hypothetical protein
MPFGLSPQVRLLPLKHASTWKEAEALRRYVYALSQHALRHGIAWLRTETRKATPSSSSSQLPQVSADSIDPDLQPPMDLPPSSAASVSSTSSESSSSSQATQQVLEKQMHSQRQKVHETNRLRSRLFGAYTRFVCICSQVETYASATLNLYLVSRQLFFLSRSCTSGW